MAPKTDDPYDPCSYEAVDKGTMFPYDPKKNSSNCTDSDTACLYVSVWENDMGDAAQASANDLNNLACAYLWLSSPNWDLARDYFSAASEMNPRNKTIKHNLEQRRIPTPRPFRIPVASSALSAVKLFVELARSIAPQGVPKAAQK